MKPLFDLTAIPPRPTITPEMIRKAATVVAKHLDPNAFDYTGMIENLCEQYEPHIDGYDLAKKLEENCWWDISASDVEWLDTMDSEVNDLLIVEVKKWVNEHSIIPPYPIGTCVRVSHTNEFGVVTKSDEYAIQRATYLLKMDTIPNDHRRVVKYEDVTYVS